MAVGRHAYRARLLAPGEEPAAVDALQAAFGRWPAELANADPLEHFRWKHLQNPLGRSLMLVAEAESRVIGFAAWLPSRFRAGDQTLDALRGVDLGVRPEYRGRGVAAALTEAAAEHFPPDTAFTFSNPNRLSKSGVIRLGRRDVGRLPILIRVRRPLRTLLGRRSTTGARHAAPPVVEAEPAAADLADDARVSALLAEVQPLPGRLSTAKDVEFLRWRYGALGHYYAVPLEQGGRLVGLGIFRVLRHGSSWNMRVCELFVADDDRRRARRLLRSTLAAAAVDYVTCHFADDTLQRATASRCGFVRLWHGETVLAYPLRPALRPDPTQRSSWALTLGDLELL